MEGGDTADTLSTTMNMQTLSPVCDQRIQKKNQEKRVIKVSGPSADLGGTP